VQFSAFMDNLKLFGMGYSWGGYESLIVPAHINRAVAPLQTGGPVIRLHVGLEDAGDLFADLEQGFAQMKAAA
jgi:cystathionine beta-lyase